MYELTLSQQERDVLMQALNSVDVRGIVAMQAVVMLFIRIQGLAPKGDQNG